MLATYQSRPRPSGAWGDGPVVRLDAAALWQRLDQLDRSQAWLARKLGGQSPPTSPCWSTGVGRHRNASVCGCSGSSA